MAALHFASCNNHPTIISALIAAGANVNIQNKNGRTPPDVLLTTAMLSALRNYTKVELILR